MDRIQRSSGSFTEMEAPPPPASLRRIPGPPPREDSIEDPASSESCSCLGRVASFFRSIFRCLCALFCCCKDDDSEDQGAHLQPYVSLPPQSNPTPPQSGPAVGLNPLPQGGPPPPQSNPPPLGDSTVPQGEKPIDEPLESLLAELDRSIETLDRRRRAQGPPPERRHRDPSQKQVSQVPLASVREKELEQGYIVCIKQDLRDQVGQLVHSAEKLEEIMARLDRFIRTAAGGKEALKLDIWDTLDYLTQQENEISLEFLCSPDKDPLEQFATDRCREGVFRHIRETLLGVVSRYLEDAEYTIFFRHFDLDQRLQKLLPRLTSDERRSIWQRILLVSDQNSFQQFCSILEGVLERIHVVEDEARPGDSLDLTGYLGREEGPNVPVENLLREWVENLGLRLPADFGINWMLGKKDVEIKQRYLGQIDREIRSLWQVLLEGDEEEDLAKQLSEITENMNRATDVQSVSDAVRLVSRCMTLEISNRVFTKRGGEIDPNYLMACAEQYQAAFGCLTAWIFYSLPIKDAVQALRIVEEQERGLYTR